MYSINCSTIDSENKKLEGQSWHEGRIERGQMIWNCYFASAADSKHRETEEKERETEAESIQGDSDSWSLV